MANISSLLGGEAMTKPVSVKTKPKEELEEKLLDYMGRGYLSNAEVEDFYLAEFELGQLSDEVINKDE